MNRKFFTGLMTCAALFLPGSAAFAQGAECAPPNVMIVLDRSGSMNEANKWNLARNAIQQALSQNSTKANWGLIVFPGPPKVSKSCFLFVCTENKDYCVNPTLNVPIGPNNAGPILNALNSTGPEGNTPLAIALNYAGTNGGLTDPSRRNFVLVISDGGDTCNGSEQGGRNASVQAVRNLKNLNISTFVVGFGAGVDPTALDQMATEGRLPRAGNPRYYQADNQAELTSALNTFINQIAGEICDGKDNDCDGQIDEDLFQDCSNKCGPGSQKCNTGTWSECTAPKPQPEVCDDKDNDCDGVADNGVKNACGKCGPVPDEVCDGADNNCNGQVDEGVLNACGKCGPTPDEVCDGADNNCDGQVDEGLDVGKECKSTLQGVCAAGVITCENGAAVCKSNVQPSPEACDGIDNDCDGTVDNIPATGGACATGLPGVCAKGNMGCVSGVDGCVPAVKPTSEICDGLDNNCDGKVDENLRNACGQCGPLPQEVCDGKDNDCNGAADDNAPCPPGRQCVMGECVRKCAAGECPVGQVCRESGGDKFCVSPCAGVQCPAGQSCENGQCKDPCVGVSCPGGQACKGGRCVADNCYEKGCPEGQACRNGACAADPCQTVKCAAGQFCRNGACVNSCAGVSCPSGETCKDGKCAADPCAACEAGMVCAEGQCRKSEGCTSCAIGQICVEGSCVDSPCLNVKCPFDQECVDGECRFQVSTEPPKECDAASKPANCCDAGNKPAAAICNAGSWSCPGGLTCKPDDAKCEGNPPSGGCCAADDGAKPESYQCDKGQWVCKGGPCNNACSAPPGGMSCCKGDSNVDPACENGEWFCPDGSESCGEKSNDGQTADAGSGPRLGADAGAAANALGGAAEGCGCSAGVPAGDHRWAWLFMTAVMGLLLRRRLFR
ncbi:MAG: hypothetical protein GMKNLPBB_02297 [Myxococcota bacterium]|nr:hypothetical protein [Myxococcota bacterium]